MKWLEFLLKDMPTTGQVTEPSPSPEPTPDGSGTTPQPTPAPEPTPTTEPTPAGSTPPGQIQPVESELDKYKQLVTQLQQQNATLAARVQAGSPASEDYREAILALTGWKGVLNNAHPEN